MAVKELDAEAGQRFGRVCERLKSQVPLVDYARARTELRRSGTVHVGRCPMADHDDRTPSFTVWGDCESEEQSWWCFGCDRGSDVIDLHALLEGHSETFSAVVSLSEMYGIELPERSDSWKAGQSRKARYLDAARRVKGQVLARRTYSVEILPLIKGIEDEKERERELERSWREWQRELPWHLLADEMLRRVPDRAMREVQSETATLARTETRSA